MLWSVVFCVLSSVFYTPYVRSTLYHKTGQITSEILKKLRDSALYGGRSMLDARFSMLEFCVLPSVFCLLSFLESGFGGWINEMAELIREPGPHVSTRESTGHF